MSIKKRVLRLIPSYRCKDAIMDELSHLNQQLNLKNRRIADLNAKNDFLFFCLQRLEGESDLETRKRVFLSMPKAEGDLRLVQLISNYILARLKDVCDKHSLEFFLMAGTLVGAMRHKGYIPWDDDIDIGIMRKDYDQLVSILKKDNELELSSYYGTFGNRQIKVKLKKSDRFFVDLYLFDYIDVNEQNMQSRWEETQKMSRTIEQIIFKDFPQNSRVFDALRPVKLDNVEEAVVQYTQKMYEQCGYLGNGAYFCPAIDMPSSFRADHPILKVEDQFPFGELDFEGKKYGVWKNYMAYFDLIYDPWGLPYSIKPHLLDEYEIYEGRCGRANNCVC